MRPVLFFAWRDKREAEGWKQLRVGGIDGISCQHLQVLMKQLLQKHWEWQEENKWHVYQKRPTHVRSQHGHQDVFLNVARPIAYCENSGRSRSSRSAGLEGQATFENVECTSSLFTRCMRQGSVEAPPRWLRLSRQILWNVEPA